MLDSDGRLYDRYYDIDRDGKLNRFEEMEMYDDIIRQRIGEDDNDGVKMFKGALKVLDGELLASFTKIFEELYKESEPQVYLYELSKDVIGTVH